MKHALVTGSTKGIGYAIAEKLIERGFYVFCNYAHDDTINIPWHKENHSLIKADLSTLSGVETLVDAIIKKINKLDCIIFNTGMTCREPFGEITYDNWQRVMDTNVNMPFFLLQKLSGNIAENGSLVFISSVLSYKPHAISIPYGVSKAAVNMLALTLVKEFAPRGIRVNVLCPGFIETEWQKEKPEWLKEKITNKVAIRRFGKPEEVATACMNLIDNEYINGTILTVDGGYDME